MRDRLWEGLRDRIPDIRLNGHPERRVPHNLHVSVRGVVGEDILLMLDAAGICASTGSACQSGSVEASYVLAACGVSRDWATGALRFTFGRANDDGDVEAVLESLPRVVDRLRSYSRAR
jgi:cysteine desulfurase